MAYEEADIEEVVRAHGEIEITQNYLDVCESWPSDNAFLEATDWIKKVVAPSLLDEDVIRALIELHSNEHESNEKVWRISLEGSVDYDQECSYFDEETESYVIPKKISLSNKNLAPVIECCIQISFDTAYDSIPDYVGAGYEALSREHVHVG